MKSTLTWCDKNGNWGLNHADITKVPHELYGLAYKLMQYEKLGYFAIILDETKEEYEPFRKEVFVYFLDEIVEEVAIYADCEIRKKG